MHLQVSFIAVTSWILQIQTGSKKMSYLQIHSVHFFLPFVSVCPTFTGVGVWGGGCRLLFFPPVSLLVLSWGQAQSDRYRIAKHASWSELWNKSIISPTIRKHVSCFALWPDEWPNKPWCAADASHSAEYESVISTDPWFPPRCNLNENFSFNWNSKQNENIYLTCRRRLVSQIIVLGVKIK